MCICILIITLYTLSILQIIYQLYFDIAEEKTDLTVVVKTDF